MAKKDLISVQFLRSWQGYYAGDRAGFDAKTVAHLDQHGTVVRIDPKTGKPVESVTAAPEPETPSGSAEASTATHDISADDAAALAGKAETQDELEALWKGEMAHPKFEGGRKTVLQAIRERLQALKGDQ